MNLLFHYFPVVAAELTNITYFGSPTDADEWLEPPSQLRTVGPAQPESQETAGGWVGR